MCANWKKGKIENVTCYEARFASAVVGRIISSFFNRKHAVVTGSVYFLPLHLFQFFDILGYQLFLASITIEKMSK